MSRRLPHVPVVLGVLLAVAGSACAEGELPGAPAALPQADSTAESLARAVENTHSALQQNILEKTIQLDDFFGRSAAGERSRARYDLRLRSSLRGDEKGRIRPGIAAIASLNLSRTSSRLQLAVSGSNEPEEVGPKLPEDPGNPGFHRTGRGASVVNTELRYTLWRNKAVNTFLGAGFRVSLPFESFVRSRIQLTRRFDSGLLARAAETVFVRNSDGVGETTELDLHLPLNAATMLRWDSTATAVYQAPGLEWGSELSLIRALSPASTATLLGGVYGESELAGGVQNSRLLLRYRRNFLRSWLYYEVEPEISWPRGESEPNDPLLALTVRIEVVFSGNSASRPPAAPRKPGAAPPLPRGDVPLPHPR